MPEYFVVRSSTDAGKKSWILQEIKAGRLRQGWFAGKSTALVSNTGVPKNKTAWIPKFRSVVRRWVSSPTNKEEKRYLSAPFAKQKYSELQRLLDIHEGDLLVVPKLDGNGGEDGFVLARAANARRTLGASRNCYWFDRRERKGGVPSDDYRHVVAVDPATVRVVANDHSKLAAAIADDLELREAPVVHSRNDDFNRHIERLYSEVATAPDEFTGKPLTGKVERQQREKIKRDISQRRGQPAFRQKLLDTYKRCCAMSGCDAIDALEAAHIRTFKGEDDNDVRNGILLRADLHTLFDLGLISVRTSSWKVIVAPRLRETTYGSFHGKPLKMPADKKLWPKETLEYHRRTVFGKE